MAVLWAWQCCGHGASGAAQRQAQRGRRATTDAVADAGGGHLLQAEFVELRREAAEADLRAWAVGDSAGRAGRLFEDGGLRK